MEPIDMHELLERGPREQARGTAHRALREGERARHRRAGARAASTTVLDVKIRTFPTHAASKPIAMIPNCAATRHAHFVLDGSGPVALDPPSLDLWPDVHWTPSAESRRVNLDALTREEVAGWKPGETLLLSGRSCSPGAMPRHKRLAELLNSGQGLPPGVDLRGRVIYYVGPVDAGARRGRRSRGPDHRDAHGQVHRPDARKTGLLGDDRQGRARARRDRIDPQARIRIPHRDRRRGIPRVEGDPKARASSRSRTSAWRRSTSSRSRTCR